MKVRSKKSYINLDEYDSRVALYSEEEFSHGISFNCVKVSPLQYQILLSNALEWKCHRSHFLICMYLHLSVSLSSSAPAKFLDQTHALKSWQRCGRFVTTLSRKVLKNAKLSSPSPSTVSTFRFAFLSRCISGLRKYEYLLDTYTVLFETHYLLFNIDQMRGERERGENKRSTCQKHSLSLSLCQHKWRFCLSLLLRRASREYFLTLTLKQLISYDLFSTLSLFVQVNILLFSLWYISIYFSRKSIASKKKYLRCHFMCQQHHWFIEIHTTVAHCALHKTLDQLTFLRLSLHSMSTSIALSLIFHRLSLPLIQFVIEK